MKSRCTFFAILLFATRISLFAQPAVVTPIPPLVIGLRGTNISLVERFSGVPADSEPGVLVVCPFGSFVLDLLAADAPRTVDNFLSYVDDGSYLNVMVHRSVPGFVVQTGGFKIKPSVDILGAGPPVTNEFSVSNTRGTVAMARVGGQTNSATSQWFINLADNSRLDSVDGGFTVFARVRGNGMSVVDQIAALPVYSLTNISPAFGEVPLRGIVPGQSNIFLSNLVPFENVLRFPFSVRSSDPSAWSAKFSSNNILSLAPGTNSAKPATITVEGTDLQGRTAKTSFVVKSAPARAYSGIVGFEGRRAIVSLVLSPSGAFTAKAVESSASALRVRERLDLSGINSLVLPLAAGKSVALRYIPASDLVTVASSDGTFELRPVAWTGAGVDVSPLAGKLANTLFDLGKGGYARLHFDKSGAAKVGGLLADGSKITASFRAVVGEQTDKPLLPFLVFWKTAPVSHLYGTLALNTSPSAGAEAVSGTLQLKLRALPGKDLGVAGSFWSPPSSAQTLDFLFRFENGPVPGLPVEPVAWSLTAAGKPVFPGSSSVSAMKVSATAGAFSGKVGGVPFSGLLTGPLPSLGDNGYGGGFAGPIGGSAARVTLVSP